MHYLLIIHLVSLNVILRHDMETTHDNRQPMLSISLESSHEEQAMEKLDFSQYGSFRPVLVWAYVKTTSEVCRQMYRQTIEHRGQWSLFGNYLNECKIKSKTTGFRCANGD